MESISARIMAHAVGEPEGTPICARTFQQLGRRPAVRQALSRLARRGALLRAARGLYFRKVETRFGPRAPAADKAVAGLASRTGERLALGGVAATNALGLASEVPVGSLYLTSGPSRSLCLGNEIVQLKHGPDWQLALPGSPSGDVIRALAWLGEAKAAAALDELGRRLPVAIFLEIASAGVRPPAWIAGPIDQIVADAAARERTRTWSDHQLIGANHS